MDSLDLTPVYARRCVVRRISRPEAAAFLDAHHRMGYARSRYHYGLFLPEPAPPEASLSAGGVETGPAACTHADGRGPLCGRGRPDPLPPPADGERLVAVATFSGSRRWQRAGRAYCSCEWVRYASLPGLRVLGGMGKLLEAFVSEVHPDDVMTYCDPSWSDGDAYRALGFVEEGVKDFGTYSSLKFRRTFPMP